MFYCGTITVPLLFIFFNDPSSFIYFLNYDDLLTYVFWVINLEGIMLDFLVPALEEVDCLLIVSFAPFNYSE
jgi:hypothetical protein